MESRSLDQQREEFANRRFLATPLAGLIAWSIIGIAGPTLPPFLTVITLFVATGSIVYLVLLISKFTGEGLLDRSKPKNAFDRLFFYTVASSLVVFGIAIPFFLVDYTSLPLTVGTSPASCGYHFRGSSSTGSEPFISWREPPASSYCGTSGPRVALSAFLS